MKHHLISRAFAFIILAFGVISIWIPSGCDKLVTEVTNTTVFDTTTGLACLQCHSDQANLLARPQAQWENSRHANSDLIDAIVEINGRSFAVNNCGAVCHTHEKFVNDIDSVSVAQDKFSPITCFTCHKPHTGPYGTWSIDSLRGWDTYVRLANDSLYQMGKSSSCAHCHRATGEPPEATAADSVVLTATWGPHWSAQAEVVSGKGGHRFRDSIFVRRHQELMANQNGCLKCHFGSGQGNKFGEHTFRLEDTVSSQQFVSNCNQSGCHSGGAGVLANVVDLYDFPTLDSIAKYGDSLETLLRSRHILDTSDATGMTFYPDSTVQKVEAQVLFNYLMYRFDGSRGIHNPEFMHFLLKRSVAYWDSMPPEAQFVANVTSGCVPFDVQFTATYSGLIDSVKWDFEDGTTSNLLQPLHTFTTAGIRSIALWVYGPGGTSVVARQNYISANQSPLASFTANETTGCDSLAVQFTSTSTGTIYSWTWNFGDDSTSAVEDPMHTYRNPGVYAVSLITVGPCGADTSISTDSIRISANPPASQFAVDVSNGCDSLAVTFTDQSTGDIDSWKYLFGDGDSALIQNTTHTYRTVGTFYPRLITVGLCGVDTSAAGGTAISVTTLPIAAFSADSTTIAANNPLGFLDESINAVGATRIWDWGDTSADTTTAEFMLHTYLAAGTYTVTLTVTNSCGQDIDQKLNYILVQ